MFSQHMVTVPMPNICTLPDSDSCPFCIRIEGPLNLLRPVNRSGGWMSTIKVEWIELISNMPTVLRSFLEWKYLWPSFAQWFREGL